MALTRGSFRGYEFDRMVVLFSMIDGQTEVSCAVSTSAMDELERPEGNKPHQREAQFMRLRIASKSAPPSSFLQGSSKARRPASFCAAWIFGSAPSHGSSPANGSSRWLFLAIISAVPPNGFPD